MKKTILTLLVALLFLPVSCFAVESSLYVGTWVQVDAPSTSPMITMIHLTEDHRCFFLYQTFHEDNTASFGRTFCGKWTALGDYAYLTTGENSTMKVMITSNGFLAHDLGGAYSLYGRVPVFSTNDATYGPVSIDQLETGVVIPTGTYIIGEDIPAGSYRFDMNVSDATVEYYSESAKYKPTADFSLNARSTTYGKINLEEGGTLYIKNSSVIMSYAKSLFQ